MRPFPALLLAGLGLALTGCASALGTNDEVTVTSEPAGAACRVERMAQPVAVIPATPATVSIPRSRFPIDIHCTKEGLAGSETVWPGVNPMVYGDLLLAGVPYLIDSVNDADRSLPDSILVRFPITQ